MNSNKREVYNGHGAGDEALVLCYQTCLDAMRSSDVVARIAAKS